MDVERIKLIISTFTGYFQQYPNSWGQLQFEPQAQRKLTNELIFVSQDVETSHPFISHVIFTLKDHLFSQNWTLNPVVLGELLEALDILLHEEKDAQTTFWSCIHPRICLVSKKLYEDGHYADSAVDAFIEINDRVKQIYKRLSPNPDKSLDGQALMNKVFSKDDALLEICNRGVESGEDIHNGTRFMLVGAMSALRNPKAHANITISAEEAMRRLMFASMLMYMIDDAEKQAEKRGELNEQYG